LTERVDTIKIETYADTVKGVSWVERI